MSLLLKNCRLIPALSDGYNKTYADVKVEDGKIVQVGTCGLDTLEMNATVINCKGKTLLPGLFDMHAHLNWDYYNGVVRLNDFKLLINSGLSAKKYLDWVLLRFGTWVLQNAFLCMFGMLSDEACLLAHGSLVVV